MSVHHIDDTGCALPNKMDARAKNRQKFLYYISSLITGPNLKYLHMNISHYTLYHNCTNGFALPKEMLTRAIDKNVFKQYLLLNR